MIYEHEGVSVDRDFARFGSTSYSIAQITSVEMREVERAGGNVLIMAACVLAGLFCLFVALGAWANESGGGVIISLILAAAAFKVAYSSRPQPEAPCWRLYLTTSSGQAQAFASDVPEEVLYLRDAIEQAMVLRSQP